MSWVAVAVGGAAVVGAISQNSASNKAAGAQKGAARDAIAQSELNYNRTEQNLNPYIDAGKNALSQINSLNAGDYSGFYDSPDYAYTRDQMQQGIERGAAARGSLYSGGTNVDLANALNGIASQNYGNFYNRLAGLAQMGQGAASNLGSVGTGNAAAIGGYLQNSANATQENAYNQANLTSNLAGTLGGLAASHYQGQNPPPTTSSYLGSQGTYTGANSLSTTWPGMDNASWGRLSG